MGSCNIVFEKEVIFHGFDFETSKLEFEVTKSSICKHTTSCDKVCFLAPSTTTNWDQTSHVSYFMHNVEIHHQVRRLVFDNNQKCPPVKDWSQWIHWHFGSLETQIASQQEPTLGQRKTFIGPTLAVNIGPTYFCSSALCWANAKVGRTLAQRRHWLNIGPMSCPCMLKHWTNIRTT